MARTIQISPSKAALSILFAIGDGDQCLPTDPTIDDRALILYMSPPNPGYNVFGLPRGAE